MKDNTAAPRVAVAASAPDNTANTSLDSPSRLIPSAETAKRNCVKHIYDRKAILSLSKFGHLDYVNLETWTTLHSLGLLRRADREAHKTAESPTSTGRLRRHRKQSERKQKCGCRGGLTAKLKANPFRAPLPSILLANVRSLESQLDYLKLDINTKNEIAASSYSPRRDDAVSLDGLTIFRADRSHTLTGKTRGGGSPPSFLLLCTFHPAVTPSKR